MRLPRAPAHHATGSLGSMLPTPLHPTGEDRKWKTGNGGVAQGTWLIVQPELYGGREQVEVGMVA